ncbi:MAG: Unknown protein [uncultured Aureispira sp.]|uniref:Uncharacterized protein n=1 Tax=uncultured Aureispira sp. TaxID=1331704 RepID=A0A6S6S569_9BACT|nr:MAG: Unknown protein [uncultured Aureispira sp.]
MDHPYFELESFKLLSDSLIWQLNRNFYQDTGIEAWSKSIVPHNMTSSSMVGKTYAELILGLLKDLAVKGQTTETVYILELGAGHARLAFHIIKHLEALKALLDIKLPPYCYVVSDIVTDNLNFFKNHPQLQTYFEQGLLDYAYFDAVESTSIQLRYSKMLIEVNSLQQPILAIANYFFDSIPNDLFFVQNNTISSCSIAIDSNIDPKGAEAVTLLKNIKARYQNTPLSSDFYSNAIFNEILEDYKGTLSNSYLFFPQKGFECLNNLISLSQKGLMLLSMDKGFHEIHDIDQKEQPEIITHGSFSLWVNYHALGEFCQKKGGKALFPAFSTFHLELGCLLFLPDNNSYQHTHAAYERFVNDFGPDDFNSIKKLAYRTMSKLTLVDLIALMRLSAYDSSFFIAILPRLKTVSKRINFNQRKRLAESLHQVWNLSFDLNESHDLPYELGGFFYDLGFYQEALNYFQEAINVSGPKDDIYYNQILSYYQLRQDALFHSTLKEAKAAFPESTLFERLSNLDMKAV